MTVFGHRRRRRQLLVQLTRSFGDLSLGTSPRSVRINRGELTRPKARLAVFGLAYWLALTPQY